MGKVVEETRFYSFLLLFVMCCSKSKIFLTFFSMFLNIKNLFSGNTLLKTNIFVLCHLFPSWPLRHIRCTGNCEENFPIAQIGLPFLWYFYLKSESAVTWTGSATECQTAVLYRDIQGLADLVFFASITNEESRQLNGKVFEFICSFIYLFFYFFKDIKYYSWAPCVCVCVNEISILWVLYVMWGYGGNL